MTDDRAGFDPARLVASLTYKPGWSFKLGGPQTDYLCVNAVTPNSDNHAVTRRTQHMFEMPRRAGARDFVRWIFECLLLVEQHEAQEFFAVDGLRAFYPNHNEGSPYERVERWEQDGPPS